MAAKRDMNSVLVATVEATEGVAQAATNSTDVVLAENLQIKFNQSVQSTAEVTGTLDPAKDIPIGGPAQITFDTWLKGSGAGDTTPEIDKLLQACGWSAGAVRSSIPAGTCTGTAGANTVSVTPATFAGTAAPDVGGVVQLSGNPTSAIFTSVTAFSAGLITTAETFSPALSAATVVTRPKQCVYTPISSGIVSLTFRVYKDGVLSTVAGCRGTFKMSWTAGKGIKFSWTFGGIQAFPRTDVSNPTNASPDSAQSKLVWRNDSNNGAFVYAGSRIGVETFNFDNGTTLDNAPNPNQPSGFDVADIGSRTMKFDINPRLTSIATLDKLATVRAGSTVTISAIARNAIGNSCAVCLPAAQPSSYEYAKQGPMIAESISGKATGSNAGAYICFF